MVPKNSKVWRKPDVKITQNIIVDIEGLVETYSYILAMNKEYNELIVPKTQKLVRYNFMNN